MTHDLDNPGPYRLELQARLERVLLRLDPDKPAVSASTHSAYLKACRRGLLLMPGVWGHEASPRTRSYRRAAFRYWARTQLYDRYDILAGREPRFGTVAPETFSDRGLGLVHDIEEHLTVCEGHLDAFDRTDVEFHPSHSPSPSESACPPCLEAGGHAFGRSFQRMPPTAMQSQSCP